jgi:hypothetical protein
MSWYEVERRAIERLLKQAVGSPFDNTRTILKALGRYFPLHVHKHHFRPGSPYHLQFQEHLEGDIFFGRDRLVTNVWAWTMWAVVGHHLGGGSFIQDPDRPLPPEQVGKILDRARRYSQGFIHCAGCLEEMPVTDIAGRIYAGVYCDPCWDREYRERAAKEKYD